MAIIISNKQVTGTLDNKLPFTKYEYFNVRDIAWQFLIDNKISELPIDMLKLLQTLNIKTIAYKNLDNDIFKNRLKDKSFCIIKSENDIIICYNDTLKSDVLNFTLAHELGHVVLLHKLKTIDYEKEANMFASRILMPMIVLKELNVTTAEEIAKICNVSLIAASIRFNRFNELKTRQMFLTSKLEKQVLKQFDNFIKEQKK